MTGGTALLVGKEDLVFYAGATAIFLLGLGMVSPLGTAITLQPFGKRAGAASALLGFLQMGCAALAISAAVKLDAPACTSLGVVMTSSLALAFAAILAVR